MTMATCGNATMALTAPCTDFPLFVQSRRSSVWTRAKCRAATRYPFQALQGSFNPSTPNFGNRWVISTKSNSHKSGLVNVRASVEEGVKSSEIDSSEEIRPSNSKKDSEKVESPSTSPSNPFASGKISSRISAKKAGDSQQPFAASTAQKVPLKKPAAAVKPPAAGQLSANVASQLKVARPPSVFTVPTKPDGKPAVPFTQPGPAKPVSPFAQPGASKPESPPNPFRKTPLVPTDWEKAGARPAGAGKRVLEAFRDGDKEGTTTKFGQPLVPKNIFDEVRRTPEEVAADAFKFQISPGQFFLVGSFLVIIAVMFGTVFLVWKVGAIHYNEY